MFCVRILDFLRGYRYDKEKDKANVKVIFQERIINYENL